MHSIAMGEGKSRTTSPSAKLFRLSHVRKQRECEQVAAVCYRVRGAEVEFLLVRTGSGHWTFPKGGVEPGLTHAQAAALEAFEEAGVHGRMEEASFARYVRRKRRSAGAASASEVATSAHLCEVVRQVQPQEADRNPTWFSVEKTKKKLSEGRTTDFGIELIRVVDRALGRIRRLTHATAGPADALQRVQFEASTTFATYDLAGETVVTRSQLMQRRPTGTTANGHLRRKVQQIGPTLVVNSISVKRLPAAATPNKAGAQFARIANQPEPKRADKSPLAAGKKHE